MDIEMLERKLDKRLGWRKKELLSVRADAAVALFPQQAILLRCLAVLSYAHWEGFVKDVASLYFEFIMSKGMSYAELDDALIAVAIAKRASEGTQKPTYYHDVATFVRYGQSDTASMGAPPVLDEMGMLNSDRLDSILHCLTVEKSAFELKYKWLDHSLIPARNKVAHGIYTAITPNDSADYVALCDEALILLEIFRNEIVSSASRQSYRRKPIILLDCERG
jgi:hypothetical protein